MMLSPVAFCIVCGIFILLMILTFDYFRSEPASAYQMNPDDLKEKPVACLVSQRGCSPEELAEYKLAQNTGDPVRDLFAKKQVDPRDRFLAGSIPEVN